MHVFLFVSWDIIEEGIPNSKFLLVYCTVSVFRFYFTCSIFMPKLQFPIVYNSCFEFLLISGVVVIIFFFL